LVIALVAISFIPEPKLQETHHDEDFDLVKNASRHFTVGEGRKQLPLILFMSMISFAYYPYFIFTQSALTDLGMSVEGVAWVFAATQLASAAGYFTAGKLPQKSRLKIAFIICPVLLSVLYFISQMGGMTMMVAIFFVICYIDTIIEPIYVTHLNEGFDSKIRAFSNSFDSFVQTIFISLGFYLYGVLTTH
jgi:predicted MFS family arabinose efflux permease